MRFSIRAGYHGMCGRCDKDMPVGTDVVMRFVRFEKPLPAVPEIGIPEQAGIWDHVHRGCAKPTDEVKEVGS